MDDGQVQQVPLTARAKLIIAAAGVSCAGFHRSGELDVRDQPKPGNGDYVSTRDMACAYVCLVGLPLLGLLGILRAGRHLTPPISVAGTWTLDADSSAVPVGHCTQLLANVLHGAVDISQSGDRLLLTFNDVRRTMIRGMIQQKTISTIAEHPYSNSSPDAGCDIGRGIDLRASVNRQGDALTGTVTLNGCKTCPSVPLLAVRRTPQERRSP